MALIVGLILLACTLVLIYVGLRIGAAILRTSVRLTNAVLGGRDLDEDDYRHRASAYEAIPRPKSLGGIRIPVPGVGYAILVNIVFTVVSWVFQIGALFAAVIFFGLALPERTEAPDLVALTESLGTFAVSLGAGQLATVVVLKYALPTTFFRAGVVVVWQLVICVLIGAALVGGLFALGAMNGGPVSVPMRSGGGWV
ncbi:MAG TPA: hypothetical protein VD866_31330 [Urbifossiella sp.]|nr:hypothetical protein [Urbifossiella sp.]